MLADKLKQLSAIAQGVLSMGGRKKNKDAGDPKRMSAMSFGQAAEYRNERTESPK